MRLLPPFAALEPEVLNPETPGTVSESATALDIVRAAYRGDTSITSKQLRAAIAALPFEHPKLAVVAAVSSGRDFSALMEAARRRSDAAKLIELRPRPGDGQATDDVEQS